MKTKPKGIRVIPQPGDTIKFTSEKQKYTVQASDDNFIICTKPFNPKKTVIYTIIDLKQNIRGTENLIFEMCTETKEQCEEMLERLQTKKTEVSHRNRIELDIEQMVLNI